MRMDYVVQALDEHNEVISYSGYLEIEEVENGRNKKCGWIPRLNSEKSPSGFLVLLHYDHQEVQNRTRYIPVTRVVDIDIINDENS